MRHLFLSDPVGNCSRFVTALTLNLLFIPVRPVGITSG